MEIITIADALAGVFYIATSENGQPHVRPFDGAAVLDGKFYIGTNNSKAVFNQIKENPKVEIFSMEKGVVRFTAEAYPVDDDDLNKAAYEAIGKEYSDGCAALELKNLRGAFQDSMGMKTEFTF